MNSIKIEEKYIEGAVSFIKGDEWIQAIRVPAEMPEIL